MVIQIFCMFFFFSRVVVVQVRWWSLCKRHCNLSIIFYLSTKVLRLFQRGVGAFSVRYGGMSDEFFLFLCACIGGWSCAVKRQSFFQLDKLF